ENRIDEAVECFDKGLELDPDSTSFWFERGKALMKTNKNSEAIEAFDEVLKREPKHIGACEEKANALKNKKM
ncbi:MAG: tetratricopeptide repeat protein, partial [Thermoplasmata archaeon]